MESIFETQVKIGIGRLKESNFQEFIDFLFVLKYGQDYQPIKPKTDRGCDGILNGDMILSTYAPQKENLNSFKKKIGNDYSEYHKNWGDKYPKWYVVYNGELTSDRYSRIAAQLKRQGTPIPTNDIWIAAQTMEHGVELITSDHHFEKINGRVYTNFPL